MAALSSDEKLRRSRIVASVIGTNAMEGIVLDAETRRTFDRFEEGELSIEGFSAAIDEHVAMLLAARGIRSIKPVAGAA